MEFLCKLSFFGSISRNAQFLAKHVGCGDEQLNYIEKLECLQSLPADTLLKGVVVGFTVNVDGDFAPNDAIVPVNVEETILKGNSLFVMQILRVTRVRHAPD